MATLSDLVSDLESAIDAITPGSRSRMSQDYGTESSEFETLRFLAVNGIGQLVLPPVIGTQLVTVDEHWLSVDDPVYIDSLPDNPTLAGDRFAVELVDDVNTFRIKDADTGVPYTGSVATLTSLGWISTIGEPVRYQIQATILNQDDPTSGATVTIAQAELLMHYAMASFDGEQVFRDHQMQTDQAALVADSFWEDLPSVFSLIDGFPAIANAGVARTGKLLTYTVGAQVVLQP